MIRKYLGATLAALFLLTLVTVSPTGAQQTQFPPIQMTTDQAPGYIHRLYGAAFDRPADAQGMEYWMGVVADGASIHDIAWAFLAGAEWAASEGDLSDADFVALLYQNTLDREPDAEGAEYWVGVLADGAHRNDLLVFFSDSEEFRNNFSGTAMDLNILHINDHHSHLDASDVDIPFGDDREATVEMGGFARVSGQIKALEAEMADDNVVKIHAGDAITGSLWYSLFKGEVDAEVMNEVCFDMFALGNHEFDDGDAGTAQFLDWLGQGDCGTNVLAANVVPEVGTPLAPISTYDYFDPYVIKEYDGTMVGYVGLDIAQKTKVSSSPLASTEFLDETETAQAYIDLLTDMGVHNIVLVTHYQYRNDLAMAAELDGVDVIVGGDSHTLLGDSLADIGLSPAGPYPTNTTDAAGNPVCVVQAWQYSNVVGELAVSFDADGQVANCDGTPHLLLGDTFVEDTEEGDVTLEGDDAAAVQAVIDANPALTQVAPDPAVEALIDDRSAEIDVLQTTVFGTATEDLCLARVPNDGRTEIAGCETPNGGHIQQLVTDAFLARAFEADIALQNSGGIRVDIPAGDMTVADAYELLPFANTMVEIELTGAEIKATLEEGVSNIVDNAGSTGAYPYGSGIRWDLDMTAANGSRFSNVEVRPKGTTDWIALADDATYTVVTNSFMASGGDGYATLGAKWASGDYVDTFLDYAQTFIDYVEQDAGGSVGRPTDYSTQGFTAGP